MDEERQKRLKPILDRVPQVWGARGFEIGKGWDSIVLKLDKELAKLMPDYEVHQVKEKFGGLRYYTSAIPQDLYPEVDRLIRKAEALANKTCEDCGDPGGPTNIGFWHVTMCEPCRVKAQAARDKRDAELKETSG